MRNFEIKNNDSRAPCGREKVYQSNLVNQSEGYLNIYSTPLTPALSHKGRGSQSGRSMIEMLGVLAIIGVLSVGGIAGYSKAMMKYRINKTIEQITLIAGNVRAFWGSQKNYIEVECCSYWKDGSCNDRGCSNTYGTDIDGNLLHTYKGCPIHKKAKIFPDEMITVTDGKIMSITNPFGGGIWLYPVDKSKSGDYQAFRIEYYGFPKEACIELATHDWSNAGAYIAKINYKYISKIPVDLEIATQYCFRDESEIWLYFNVDANSTYWTEQLGER